MSMSIYLLVNESTRSRISTIFRFNSPLRYPTTRLRVRF